MTDTPVVSTPRAGSRPDGLAVRRETSGGAHFAALDGYRAVAALMVVVTHVAFATGLVVTSSLGHAAARLDIGVTLFFILSGFLLYRPWARAAIDSTPRPSVRRYAWRRAARILPLYWVVVVATLALLPEVRPAAPGVWLAHLTALQIYSPVGMSEGLTQTWSLCTEIAFYVTLPIVATLFRARRGRSAASAWRRQWTLILVLVAVATAWNVLRVTTDVLPDIAGYWLPGYLDWFALGMALALVEVGHRRPGPGTDSRLVRVVVAAGQDPTACLALAAATFGLALSPIAGAYDFSATGSWESLIKHGLYAVAAGAFLLPALVTRGAGFTRWLARPLPARIGLISYGIFLWHLMLLRLLMPALGIWYFTGRFLEVLTVLVVVTLLVAAVTYRLVERPAQRWAHRR